MNTAQLSKICRCGHPRRQHETGTIFVSYSTKCHRYHSEGPYEYIAGCFYFEAAEGWERDFTAALRAEGYIVALPERDALGHFRRPARAPR